MSNSERVWVSEFMRVREREERERERERERGDSDERDTSACTRSCKTSLVMKQLLTKLFATVAHIMSKNTILKTIATQVLNWETDTQ